MEAPPATDKLTEKPPRRNQRRAVPRIPVDFPVLVTAGKKRVRTKALELSEFGIFVDINTEHELIGKNIHLDLTLEPKRQALSVGGLVLYDTERGMGIRFDDVTPENHAALKAYVQARGIGSAKASL